MSLQSTVDLKETKIKTGREAENFLRADIVKKKNISKSMLGHHSLLSKETKMKIPFKCISGLVRLICTHLMAPLMTDSLFYLYVKLGRHHCV